MGQRVFGVGSAIDDVHRLLFKRYPTRQRSPARGDYILLVIGGKLGRESKAGHAAKAFALGTEQEYHLGITQARCGFGQCLQDKFQVKRRPADHLQNITDRGLVFERFLQIAGPVAQFVQ